MRRKYYKTGKYKKSVYMSEYYKPYHITLDEKRLMLNLMSYYPLIDKPRWRRFDRLNRKERLIKTLNHIKKTYMCE